MDQQVAELRSARSADDVLRVLSHERNPYGPGVANNAHGFFAGSGGDQSVYEALNEAGWTTLWFEASYHFAMRAPDGSAITYVEGDIFRGGQR